MIDSELPQTAQDDASAPSGAKAGHDRQFVTALARGVSILRCFSASQPALGASELSRMTGLPQPTVWRLCHTLLKLGLLTTVESSDKFQIGLAVLGLGISALPSTDIGELALSEMRRLANQYQAAISLCVPDQTDMLITERAQGSGSLVLNLSIGSRFEIGASSPGAAYAACLSETAKAALFADLEKQYGDRWPSILEKFASAEEQLDAVGFVASHGELRPGISSVAVPIVLQQDTVVFVLTCGGPTETLSDTMIRDQVGPSIRMLAANIGEALRASGKHGFVGFSPAAPTANDPEA